MQYLQHILDSLTYYDMQFVVDIQQPCIFICSTLNPHNPYIPLIPTNPIIPIPPNNQYTYPQKQRKLTQLSNQQLIQLNTQQSLKIVQSNIKKMQQLRLKQDEELKQLNEKVTFMDKHHNESVLKEQQLLDNIKQQEEELQRIKKRADKEIQDSKDYGITKLVKQLLEFADSIKRCKQMAENLVKEKPDDQYLLKLIDLDKQLRQLLKLYQIEEFDPINQPFDPNTSQSLVTIPTPPGYQKNNVATTMMTGYKIKSRLLRSAKVGIFI